MTKTETRLALRGNRYYLDFYDSSGKRCRVSTKTSDRKEAERFRDEWRGPTATTTVEMLLRRWCGGYTECHPDYRNEVHRVARHLRDRAGHLRGFDLTRSVLQDHLRQYPTDWRTLRVFLNWGVDALSLRSEVLSGYARLRPSRKKQRTPSITDEDLSALLADLAGSKLYPIVHFLSKTGLRSVDATRLTWASVSPDGGTARIIPARSNKGFDRVIPIPSEVVLPPRGADDEPVFGMSKRGFEYAWRSFKRRNPQWGSLSIHSLRVRVATKLSEKGLHALSQAMLGHTTVSMTAHYTRPGDAARDVLDAL